MIRDVTEFSRTGVVCRRVDELDVPVGAWRPAMCHAGRRQGARVRTFLIPPSVVSADEPRIGWCSASAPPPAGHTAPARCHGTPPNTAIPMSTVGLTPSGEHVYCALATMSFCMAA